MAKADSIFSTGKPVRIPKPLRQKLEAAIENHLAAAQSFMEVLDSAGGDPEAEGDDADDEPALGSQSPSWDNFDQRAWAFGNTADLEDEHDGAECTWPECHSWGHTAGNQADEDMEDSLGWHEGINQDHALRACYGTRHTPNKKTWFTLGGDLEQDNDSEPSHGSLDQEVDQGRWGHRGKLAGALRGCLDEAESISEDEGSDEKGEAWLVAPVG